MRHQRQNTSTEHQRLLRLAREYRKQGYLVTLYPPAETLPPALASCPPDLIAEGNGEVVVAEVRTRDNLTLNGSQDLRSIAKQVQQLPGWNFELVVTNARKES